MEDNGHALENPLQIRCQNCGAPAQFDIIHQNYHCVHCGSLTSLDAPAQKLKEYRQKKAKELKIRGREEAIQKLVCQNCGAIVVMDKGEASAACAFCGSKLVNDEFLESEAFPDMIIPFKLTLQEAKAQMQEWANKNSRKEEAALVKKDLDSLAGYYLPYQIVKGPVRCQASRNRSDRVYNCGGFVDEVAVNTSKQLDNALLEAMEPFDWDELRPFDFGYIAGMKTKLQDASGKELFARAGEEVKDAYLPTLEKTLHSRDIDVQASLGNVLTIPALMPVYIINTEDIAAVVNGQTGRVAVTPVEDTVTHRWWIEPLLITIVLAALAYILPAVFGSGGSWEMAGMIGVVVGLISFTAAEGTRSVHKTIYFQGPKLLAKRDKMDLVYEKSEKLVDNPTLTPVFYEKFSEGYEPVRISFFTPDRVIIISLLILFLGALPCILAMFYLAMESPEGTDLAAAIGNLEFGYAAAWWCLFVPCCFIFWIAFVRRDIFNMPVMKRMTDKGRWIRVKDPAREPVSIKEILKLAFMPPFIWIVLFCLFLIMGSCGAMVM